MATIVNMHQAKASLSRLVERALAGEEVVISRNGQPLIRLTPVPVPQKREPHVLERLKSEASISPDAEFTELFEAPVEPPTVS